MMNAYDQKRYTGKELQIQANGILITPVRVSDRNFVLPLQKSLILIY